MSTSPDQSGSSAPHSLTCIQPCIHSAAPSQGADPLQEIEVENFLDTLVDVAFAVAARTSTTDEPDWHEEKKE